VESLEQIYAAAELSPEEIGRMPAHIDGGGDIGGEKDFYDSPEYNKLANYFYEIGEMDQGTLRYRTGDADQWILQKLESLMLQESEKLKTYVFEELGMMNGNGSAYGLPWNWANKVEPSWEVELEESPESDEAFRQLGMFLAKLANEGHDELANELDQILVMMQDAGIVQGQVQEGLDGAQWGVQEAYYGSIPGEPETPAGYGSALDAAKVQQHLSDEIDDLVRLGKIDINDLSVETVRANQEIPWDKFQAIDDEVLGDMEEVL